MPDIKTLAGCPQILVADDQADVLDALRLLLQPEGFRTEMVRSPAAVLEALSKREFDLLLMDLNYARDTTSGREGLDLLSQVRTVDEQLPVVVMTGWGTMEVAIEALRHGVRDFIQKPWDNDRVVAMVRALTDARRGERHATARHTRELDQARDIQRHLLPPELPSRPGWDLAAVCEAAASVGGDTYDVIALDDRWLALCVGDVAGKGIPAALLAANLQAAVRSAVGDGRMPADVCARVNRTLCPTLPDDRFVSFFFAILDTRDGTFHYCNAGHNPPVLVHSDGRNEVLAEGGTVLGICLDSRYAERTVRMASGDTLVLYTDGITEACDATGDEFGERRLTGIIIAAAGAGDAGHVRDCVLEAVRTFSAGRHDDDQTLMVVCRR
jgi:sigma-B regulation protein RsbU (phosphoserine phosphatase)